MGIDKVIVILLGTAHDITKIGQCCAEICGPATAAAANAKLLGLQVVMAHDLGKYYALTGLYYVKFPTCIRADRTKREGKKSLAALFL